MSDRRFPLPPAEMIQSVGGGDYDATGQHFFDLFTKHCGLSQTTRVLDVGSGCGRLAIPLTRHLSPETEYHGIDVVLPMVEWCRKNITPRAPNFHFHHADLSNTLYNEGTGTAATYRFPFDDESFDFVYLTSVFTHLNPADAKNYLNEIRRVLAPKGRAFMTFYLLNETYEANRKDGTAKVTFDHGEHPYWVNDPAVPEAISAYDETFALRMIRQAGLKISLVAYGGWNNCRGWSFQDAVVAWCD